MLLLPVTVLSGCGASQAPTGTSMVPAERDVVVATCRPVFLLAKAVLGDTVTVECALPPGATAQAWQPTAGAIADLQRARLILVQGAGYETWVTHTTLPRSRLVATTADLTEPLIQYEDVVTHQHGPGDVGINEGTDPHTWLDPLLAIEQAQKIAVAAQRAWPVHADVIEENLAGLKQELRSIDADLRMLTVGQAKTIRFLAIAPKYNYLARRYDWKLELVSQPEHAKPAMAVAERTVFLSPGGVDGEDAKGLAAISAMVERGVNFHRFSTLEESHQTEFVATMKQDLQQLTEGLAKHTEHLNR